MRTVRIFVSSPNDALDERRRVSRVVERLNGAFRDSVRFEAVRWEERFYSAHDGFQPQIPRSSECDLVLAILRGRLGSPLSQAFHAALPPEERLPDGASYPSGTAYEILSAIRQRQRGGELPDIYVFRWPEPPQVSLDAPERAEIEAQWQALKHFAEAVFLTPEGHFKGAYQSYRSLDDFEAQVEALLRDWLKAHVVGDRTVLWPVERGSPFRGLEPFGMRHAEVFFGRTREVARALDKLKQAAGQGSPFQLVVGPSGAGKSSFVRAGLVPKLTAPGEVEGVGAWRVALLRPGESPEGPVAALARRLFEAPPGIDSTEAGRPAALPELSMGAFTTPEALGRLLAHADETSAAPILAALARVAADEQEKWGAHRPLPARLLLVVDQLDEMFATAITDAQRAEFGRLLEALGRTGAVWVVATLRAEFYEVFLKSPLAVLAGDERTFTLKPPGLAEMAEIVREPARAAALVWESDPETGERLDERLLADIDRPDLLPLLQFVLDRLYEKREGGSGDEPFQLTFSAYRALGTLDGALDQAGQQALASLGLPERAKLPRLLRALVTPASAASSRTTLTLQSVPLAQAAPDEASQRLARALVNARILITNIDKDAGPQISLAHQRVIEAWKDARSIILDSIQFYRVSESIVTQRKRWEYGKKNSSLLIPKGLLLAEAEQHIKKYIDEVSEIDLIFVKTSRRKANRLNLFIACVVVGSISLAAFSAYQRNEAVNAVNEANESKLFSQSTLSSVVNLFLPTVAYSNMFTSSQSSSRINRFVEKLGQGLDSSSADDATKRTIFSINYILSEMYSRSGSSYIQIKLSNKAIEALDSIKNHSKQDFESKFNALIARGKAYYNISFYENSVQDLEGAQVILDKNIIENDEFKSHQYSSDKIELYMSLLKNYVSTNNADRVKSISEMLNNTIKDTWNSEFVLTHELFDLLKTTKRKGREKLIPYIQKSVDASFANMNKKGNGIRLKGNESMKNSSLFLCKAASYYIDLHGPKIENNYIDVAKSIMEQIKASGDNWFRYNYETAKCMNDLFFSHKAAHLNYYGPPEEQIDDIISDREFSSVNISAAASIILNSFLNSYEKDSKNSTKRLIERSDVLLNIISNRASLRDFDHGFNDRNVDLANEDAVSIIDLLIIRIFENITNEDSIDAASDKSIRNKIKQIELYSRGVTDNRVETDIVLLDLIKLIYNPATWIPIPGDQIYCIDRDEERRCIDDRYKGLYNIIKSEERRQGMLNDYSDIVKFILYKYDFDSRSSLNFIRDMLRGQKFRHLAAGGENPFVFPELK